MHDTESQGSKPRDHDPARRHRRPHPARRVHRDWRVWVAVGLMLAMVAVYVMTNDLSVWPGHRRARPPTPAVGGP